MKNKANILIAVSIFILAAMACGGTSTPDPTAAAMAQGTFQAMTEAAPKPTITVQPSPIYTFAPLPFTIEAKSSIVNIDTASAKRIYFENGATSAFVSETVKPLGSVIYSLYVIGNQPAQISLRSKNTNIKLSIYNPNLQELLSPSINQDTWKGYFEIPGVYYIKLDGGIAPEKFDLAIGIFARINIPAGATGTSIRGQTVGGNIISYAIKAEAGKILEASVTTNSGKISLTIWGFTDVYFYAPVDSGTTNFSMLMPTTQDYIIDVAPQNKKIVNYTLNVSIK